MEFFEAPPFARHLAAYLDDLDYAALQEFLTETPEAGDIVAGTGGFRKLRWADQKRGKGKRGGLRVIYYYLSGDHQIWLFTVYGKDEADDLTAAQRQQLRAAIENELSARRDARSRPGRRR